jgi:hypothetical protein
MKLIGAAAELARASALLSFFGRKKQLRDRIRGFLHRVDSATPLERTMSDAVRPPSRARAMHHHQRSMRAPLEVAPFAALLLMLKLAFVAQTCLRRARRLT